MIDLRKMIKGAAEAHGVSVNKMACRAEISPNQLNNAIRRGGVNISTICRLADALNIKPSEFMKYGEE